MERAVFLVEATGERISCLLNPEGVVMRRTAGVVSQPARTGMLAGDGLADDPLLLRGGGRTELLLDLLFDTSLAGSDRETADVRELTGPLWRLTEHDGQRAVPARVRFFFGKTWNVPGIVEAVAERLEHFTPSGVPQRSWLRLRLVRSEPPRPAEPAGVAAPAEDAAAGALLPSEEQAHQAVGGGGTPEEPYGERVDELAALYYGDASLWRLLATANGLERPPWAPAGEVLRIPPAEAASGEGQP